MSGLVFILILAFWIFVCYRFSILIFCRVKNIYVRSVISIVFSIFIFFIPVIDEIIGALKFNELCSENLYLKYDKNFENVKYVFSDGVRETQIDESPIAIFERVSSFKDVKTSSVVIEWNSLHAEGGRLSKMLNLFQSDKPYVFDGSCISSEWKKTIFSDLNINVEYR
jgi:predicted membrane protein